MNNKDNSPSNKIALSIFLGACLIAVSILIGFSMKFLFNNEDIAGDPKKVYENITFVKTAGSPYLGNVNAPVTIIEYVDFECPICKRVFDEIYPLIKNEYINTGKIKFVFKSLPLEHLHKSAFRKTEAAYCAFDQGGDQAFFAYHDLLFTNFSINIPVNIDGQLGSFAEQNGLDSVKFLKCLSDSKYKTIIEKDIVESMAIKAEGTPTWLIGKTKDNGISETIKLNGLYQYSVYKTIIDQLLTES